MTLDSVEHPDLFKAMRNIGINEEHDYILEDSYTTATSRIHQDKDVFVWGHYELLSFLL